MHLPAALPAGQRRSTAATSAWLSAVDREDGDTEVEQPSTFRRQYSWALSSAEDGSSSIKLYAWGRNDTGQLGTTAECGQDSVLPEQGVAATHPLSGRNIVAIDGSSFNSAFLTGADLWAAVPLPRQVHLSITLADAWF